MTIASVARKATIRKDDTLFRANQLVQQQKTVAKQLEMQQQKIDADAKAEEADLNSERLKQFYKLEGGDIPQWQQDTQDGMDSLSNVLLDPRITPANKDKALMSMHARSQVIDANTESLKRVNTSLVGTEKQKQERNADEITKATSGYLDATAADDYDETKLQEVLANTLSTYNTENSTKNWSSSIQDQVANSLSTKNVAGGAFTQIDQKTKSGKFLVLNAAGTGFDIAENGKPTVVLTGDSLASYEAYSKGHSLEIDEYIENNTKEGGSRFVKGIGIVKLDDSPPTRLEAMEAILREKGAFNIRETVKTDVKTTPKEEKESSADKNARIYKENVRDRVDFLTGDSANNMAVLERGRGVVASGEMLIKGKDGRSSKETVKTGVEKKDGKTVYTLVIDPNKVETASIISANVGGEGGIPMTVIGEKTAKIQKVTITVDDKNPRAGLIGLSLLYNATVPTKLRVDTDDVIKEFDRREALKNTETKLTPAQQALADRQNKSSDNTSATKLTPAQQAILDRRNKN